MTGVKICGLTRPGDVALAAALGASHVGFNCSPRSPRRADLRIAAELARESGNAKRVGVFVDETAEEIRRAVDALRLDFLQIHRALRASDLDHGLPVVAVARVDGEAAEVPETALLRRCRAILFDTADPGRPGGTGNSFDWRLLERMTFPVPMWLAGGLRADNVGEAILRGRPEVVDVASGVESSPGVKDKAKLEAFFLAARRA